MNSLYYQTMLVLILGSKAFADSNCTTIIEDKKRMTSCINIDLTTDFMNEIMKDTAILYLKFNNAKSISFSSFKGLPQLVELDLSNNALSNIEIDYSLALEYLNLANNSFTTLPIVSKIQTLTKLVLSHNNIEIVPESALNGLKALKEIDLQRNKISHLSDQVFEELPQLESLNLSFNDLRSVSRYLISSAKKLEKFYLTGNKLTVIPQDFFIGPELLAYVYLDQNPWYCNCALKYFKDWIQENPFNIYIIENGHPQNNEFSVICDNIPNTPLLNYDFSNCGKSADTVNDNLVPKSTVMIPSTPWKTSTQEIPSTTTMRQITTTEPATTFWRTSKMSTIMTSTEVALKTTTLPTTTSVKTKPTTFLKPIIKLIVTTHGKVSTVKEDTTIVLIPTTNMGVATTTHVPKSTTLNEEPRTTEVHSLPKMLTIGNMTEEPNHIVTTVHNLPATNAPVAPARMEKQQSWMEDTIIRHCCFLHLLIYLLICFLLLVQIVATTVWLLWAYVQYYSLYHDFSKRSQMVRLTRYSLRVQERENNIFSGYAGNRDSSFTSYLLTGATPMLVLEAGPRDQMRKYTSAIL